MLKISVNNLFKQIQTLHQSSFPRSSLKYLIDKILKIIYYDIKRYYDENCFNWIWENGKIA